VASLSVKRGFGSPTAMCGESCKGRSISNCRGGQACRRPDYAVMVPLSEAPNGQLRTKDLGTALGWDRSRTSHQVTRMVKRGLVVREFCEDDARGSVVGLTATGRAAIEQAAASTFRSTSSNW
jgi:hypothetical protein